MLQRQEFKELFVTAVVLLVIDVTYLYLRKNIAGIHNELWFHQQGDRSWLVISRNTLTHEILKVYLATDFSKNEKNSND